MKDFFVSYNRADRQWAEWIAWQLEEAGYTVIVQAWDIRPGSNFILEMHKAARETERTVAVLSPAYLSALYTQPEWAAALVQDPTGYKKKLLPVRVQDCAPDGLLAAVVYVDLVGKDEASAQEMLLDGVKEERAKPSRSPAFPPSDERYVPEQPRFSVSVPQAEKKERRWFHWLSGSDENLDRRNRQAMLDKVRQCWITGVLQHSLYKEVMITLALTERPTAVARALDVLVQRPDGTDRPLPPETKIGEVFDEMRGSLLILGAPGSGKSTLLLELTRDLLDQAEQDSSFPIPVVLTLSTWGEQRLPLVGWLIDELTKRYDVPQKVAQAWIEHDRVLPLLDGLDEVKEERRAACVEAINDFRKEHGFLLPLAVCCRVADYDTIGKQLRLQGAILVQPLTRQQVETYLDQLGEAGVGVRSALREDSTLWELAEAPLLLNVMTLAYSKEAAIVPFAGNTPEAQREHLFTAYVNRMFQRRSSATRYAKEQTLNWLSWLAQQMQQHALTVFYIERLQPCWLSVRQQTILKRGCLLLVLTLFLCCTGLIGGLISGLSGELIGELSTGLIFGLSAGLIDGLSIGLSLGLGVGLFGGLLGDEIERKAIPNQGIKRSARNAVIYGLIGGLSVGLIIGLFFGLIGGLIGGLIVGLIIGLIVGLIIGLIVGLFAGLTVGGCACLQHFCLRTLLVRNNSAPWKYSAFLDYAAERVFLRKVGGGYMFIHRMLLEHFASLKERSDLINVEERVA